MNNYGTCTYTYTCYICNLLCLQILIMNIELPVGEVCLNLSPLSNAPVSFSSPPLTL